MTSNIENDWLKYAPRVLIGHAGWDIASGLRDFNAKTIFEEMTTAAANAIRISSLARDVMGQRYVMGGTD